MHQRKLPLPHPPRNEAASIALLGLGGAELRILSRVLWGRIELYRRILGRRYIPQLLAKAKLRNKGKTRRLAPLKSKADAVRMRL